MLPQLINHSTDLKRLQEEGYVLEIVGNGGHVLVRQIPYLNASLEIKYGILICALTLATPTRAGKPKDHTILFCGEAPYNADGTRLDAIINNSNSQPVTAAITANHMFSSKPICGYYEDYYEKFRTYSQILLTQARLVDCTVTATPNKNT
jgi:hypothetical protein